MGVTAADYDNDGCVDIYLTNLGPNILYRNNGDGTFTDVTEKAGVGDPRWSTSAAFWRLRWRRLARSVRAQLPRRRTRQAAGAGRPSLSLPGRTQSCAGRAGCRAPATPLPQQRRRDVQRRSARRPAWSTRTSYFGLGSVWADVDNDGDMDLYVANDATPNLLFVNKGDGDLRGAGLRERAGGQRATAGSRPAWESTWRTTTTTACWTPTARTSQPTTARSTTMTGTCSSSDVTAERADSDARSALRQLGHALRRPEPRRLEGHLPRQRSRLSLSWSSSRRATRPSASRTRST